MIYRYILALFYMQTILSSTPTPDFIKFCSPKCPAKLNACYDASYNMVNQDILYIPSLQSYYIFYAFEKGNIKIYKKTNHIDQKNNPKQEVTYFVAPTVYKKERN